MSNITNLWELGLYVSGDLFPNNYSSEMTTLNADKLSFEVDTWENILANRSKDDVKDLRDWVGKLESNNRVSIDVGLNPWLLILRDDEASIRIIASVEDIDCDQHDPLVKMLNATILPFIKFGLEEAFTLGTKQAVTTESTIIIENPECVELKKELDIYSSQNSELKHSLSLSRALVSQRNTELEASNEKVKQLEAALKESQHKLYVQESLSTISLDSVKSERDSLKERLEKQEIVDYPPKLVKSYQEGFVKAPVDAIQAYLNKLSK